MIKYQKLLALSLILTTEQILVPTESQKKEQEICDLLKQKLSGVENENLFSNLQDPILHQKLHDLVTDVKNMINNCHTCSFKQLKIQTIADAQCIDVTVKSNEDPGYHNLIAAATLSNNKPTILMSQDLIKKVSRGEVAFVFAHELGHIMHGDLEKITKSGIFDRFLLCTSIGIMVSGSQQFLWNLYKGAWRNCLIGASLAAVGSYAAKKLIGKAHKREKEADLFAAELLQSADGGIQFFERVQNAPIPFYLRLADRIIHPSDASRIQALKEWQNKRRNKDDIQSS